MKRIAVLFTALVATACAPTDTSARDSMTQRERDSVLAQSGIPGAQGVGKALTASDSASARNARLDSIRP